MNKTVNSYYGFFTVFLCMLNLRSACAKDPIGANFNYKGKYTSDIINYEIVVPQRVNKDGYFISHVVSHQHSKRSAKEMDQIFYKIPIAGKEYLIELTPNRKLISPRAVVETHKIDIGNLGKDLANSTNEKLGKMFKNLNVRKLKNTECHFSGYVKGENISKAALSTCCGLAGFIQIEKGFYTIEPIAEHDPFIEDAFPHILYKSNGLENNSLCHTIGELRGKLADQVSRKRRESSISSSTPMYIETLIVMDQSLINYHTESDCENYVLTVFNMAFNLFHDASLGLMMTLTIVRIIRLEVENIEMNLKLNSDVEKTLEQFQRWQYEINPGDDTHPNHHDVAVLITRADVCYSPLSCGLLGLSTIGKACDPKLSAALCEDNGLRLGFVIAHEIGHLLGADHDSGNSTCNGTDADGLNTVMHPQIALNSQTWSKCSQAHIKAFFKSGMGNCFLDEPEDHHFNIQDLLPGVMYNADFQCKHLITLDSRECEIGSSCDSLNCYVPGYACIVTHTPPADGTQCGESMWCHDNKCIVVGQRPGAVDGNWGEWSSWSDCTRTCGSGVSSSVRQCDKPLPSHGGKHCVGERKRYKVCATTPCKTGRPSFRDVQCGEFNDWIYPEDGKTHTWKAYYLHEDNPCILYCINEENKVAALRPRVVDGTMCYRGIRDICIGGVCKTLPCDLHFESNAIEDVCGVCHGDGTGCEFSGGTETLIKSSKELTKLINIPSGTRNIRVEELTATLAKIIVKDKETKDVYIQGKTLGMFSVPGSQAWLGMVKKNQEALNIPGPVNKPLSIWIQKTENCTVKWSMALPPSQQRKPEFAWDFLKWGPCSAKCGPGTQKSEPNCMEEKAGLVESSYCVDLEMPPAKVRPCQVTKCEPRWMVGDWKGCEMPNNTTKIRKRVVYCIKAVGEGEGESEIVSNSECPQPKPHDSEPCENRQKREDSDYGHSGPENSMFRSDTVEFGFHKKYDDYLTHFAAVSAPQRKSETIPLHLLSSPHFKHYFRVLETPEDDSTELISNGNSDLNYSNLGIIDRQDQNKVLPDFYKNTFSGNPNDVSHVQSQSDSVKSRKNGPMKRRNIFGCVRERKKAKKRNKEKNKKRWSLENWLKQSRKSKRAIPWKSFRSKGSNKSGKSQFETVFKWKRHCDLPSRCPRCPQTFPKRCFPREESHKKPRHSLLNFFAKKRAKNFNYTSPNLTDLIKNLSSLDSASKNRYINLIENGHGKGLSSWEKIRESNLRISEPGGTESFPIERISSPKLLARELSKFRVPLLPRDEISKYKMSNLRKLNKEYDGSGVRIWNCSRENLTCKRGGEESKKEKGENHKWQKKSSEEKRIHFSNPFNPLTTTRRNDFRSAKSKFKNGDRRTLQSLIAEMSKKKLQSKTLRKRNVHFLVMQEGVNDIAVYDCRMSPNRESLPSYRRKISKRLSRKWKKQKSKDSGPKGNKDVSGSGCGSETRNYLNNLFRDSHTKANNAKQEQKQEDEKTVINTGRLVVDKDLAENQEVEVMLQENYEEESNQKYKTLPLPSQKQKKLFLRGQEVFDLYQKLRQGNDQWASYGPKRNLEEDVAEKEGEKIEIDVKIPDEPQQKAQQAPQQEIQQKAQQAPQQEMQQKAQQAPQQEMQQNAQQAPQQEPQQKPKQPPRQEQQQQQKPEKQSVNTGKIIKSEECTTKAPEKSADVALEVPKTADNKTKLELSSPNKNIVSSENNSSSSANVTSQSASTSSQTDSKMTADAAANKTVATTTEPTSPPTSTTTTTSTSTTTAQTTTEDDSTNTCNDYDTDEAIPSKSSNSTTSESKKKKKGKKKQNKVKVESQEDSTETIVADSGEQKQILVNRSKSVENEEAEEFF